MEMMSNSLRRAWVRLALFAAGGMVAMSAQAGVLTGTFSALLASPGGITSDGGATVNDTPLLVSDSNLAIGDGIHANDGPGGFVDTQIGAYMLAGEYITFGGADARIQLHVSAGSQEDRGTSDPMDDILMTGYLSSGADRARYVLSGLNIVGELITGFTVTGSGFDDPTNLADLIAFDASTPDTITIFLDTMKLTPSARGAFYAGGDLNISFQTCIQSSPGCGLPVVNPMPEPGSLALVAIALAGAPLWRRRQAARLTAP